MQTDDLPKSLWSNDRFEIPESLTDSLWEVLEANGLLEMAQLAELPKVNGGADKVSTEEYLAKLCAVSCVRPMSVLLDPQKNHSLPKKLLRECTHQGKIALIDFPSGCGTTTLGLLSTVEQMRRERHWIAFDLEVSVLALDISPYALDHFKNLLDTCKRKLNRQLIQLRLETQVLDVADKETVSRVINDWVTQIEDDVDYILVVASAFSGYATQSPDNEKSVSDSFDFIKRRLYTQKEQSRFLIWMEIQSKSAETFMKKLAKVLGFSSSINRSRYKFMNPFQRKERACNLQSGCVEITRPFREYRAKR
ncbi:MAG: hypothetical protein WA949_23470 [Phormidesmis sp.]